MAKKSMLFDFEYDSEDDVLSIYNSKKNPSETIEFSEYLNIDVDGEGHIVGLEIFGASEFFKALGNENISKSFLEQLREVKVEDREFRNSWFILIMLKSNNGQVISQQLPPIRKSEFASPLIVNA